MLMDLELINQIKDPIRMKHYNFIIKEINKSLGLKRSTDISILDVGCGTGQLAGLLGNFGYQVLGIDIYQPKIEKAKEQKFSNNVSFQCRDALSLNLKGEFDVIIAADVVEHLEKPEKFVITASSLLKSGGILIITIPNGYGIKELTHRMYERYVLSTFLHKFFRHIRRCLISDDRWAVPKVDSLSAAKFPHVQFFTFKRLNSLLNNGGFRITRKQNGSFISSIYMLRVLFDNFLILKKLDVFIADILPHFLASSWLIVAKKTKV